MTNLNVFDTETTGFPLFKEPSDDPRQPHLVDIAALLHDEQGNLVDSFEAIIKPDGWVIPDEAAAIHGITNEMAMDLGIPEAEALEGFLAIHERASLRIAHNLPFDDRILRIALVRYRGEEAANQFRAGAGYCTCSNSTQIVKCPPTEKMIAAGRGRQFKQPNLAEAYRFFTGEEMQGAHRAKADAEGCARVYFALRQYHR
ncbi:3'-5' exonuclease [Ectopseudomonas khazarica]|uniref:3'-5' exonuclease n=1 Tax=Ectopseudomonas khazarica TaxID=2502979 RepID=UPI004033686E